MRPPDEIVGLETAAALCGVSSRTLRKHLRTGRLAPIDFERRPVGRPLMVFHWIDLYRLYPQVKMPRRPDA